MELVCMLLIKREEANRNKHAEKYSTVGVEAKGRKMNKDFKAELCENLLDFC